MICFIKKRQNTKALFQSSMENTMNKNIQAARLVLLGAVCGDIIGSYYESHSTKYLYDFQLFRSESRFTDDTVCSIAIADALINKEPFQKTLKYWCRKYPRAGYGFMFKRWMKYTSTYSKRMP